MTATDAHRMLDAPADRPPPAPRRRVASRALAAFWRDYQWLVLAVAAAVAVGLYWGFSLAYLESSVTHRLYLALQLFALESGAIDPPRATPAPLEVARFLAPGVTVFAAGAALLAVFRDQIQLLRLGRRSGHVVICGLGARGYAAATGFHRRGDRVVAIEMDATHVRVRTCRAGGIPVLTGSATDPVLLARARAHRARYLVCVCGDDETNAEVLAAVRRLAEEDGRPGPVSLVHVAEPALCDLLGARLGASVPDSDLVRFFNVYEAGARMWLTGFAPPGLAEGEAGRLHVVVVGAGDLGRRLAVGAVRTWLTQARPGAEPMRLTLVDRDATRALEQLRLDHPALETFCRVRALDMDVTEPRFGRARFLFDEEGLPDVSAVYVALSRTGPALTAALSCAAQLADAPVPIVVRLSHATGLAGLLGRQPGTGIRAFSLAEETCRPEVLLGETRLERLARAIHEDYMRRQREAGASPAPWFDLPEHLRESNRRQADHIGVKLRMIGCTVEPAHRGPGGGGGDFAFTGDELEALARVEHDRWAAERRFEGWTPGPRDARRRTTPYLVPYEELTEEIREHDRAAVRAIPALLAMVGLRIRRTRGPAPAQGAVPARSP